MRALLVLGLALSFLSLPAAASNALQQASACVNSGTPNVRERCVYADHKNEDDVHCAFGIDDNDNGTGPSLTNYEPCLRNDALRIYVADEDGPTACVNGPWVRCAYVDRENEDGVDCWVAWDSGNPATYPIEGEWCLGEW